MKDLGMFAGKMFIIETKSAPDKIIERLAKPNTEYTVAGSFRQEGGRYYAKLNYRDVSRWVPIDISIGPHTDGALFSISTGRLDGRERHLLNTVASVLDRILTE